MMIMDCCKDGSGAAELGGRRAAAGVARHGRVLRDPGAAGAGAARLLPDHQAGALHYIILYYL